MRVEREDLWVLEILYTIRLKVEDAPPLFPGQVLSMMEKGRERENWREEGGEKGREERGGMKREKSERKEGKRREGKGHRTHTS